jgi:hypothetical protein
MLSGLSASRPSTPKSGGFSEFESEEVDLAEERENYGAEPISGGTFSMSASGVQRVPRGVDTFYTGEMGDCMTIIVMSRMGKDSKYRRVEGRHMWGGYFEDKATKVLERNTDMDRRIYLLTSPQYSERDGTPTPALMRAMQHCNPQVVKYTSANYELGRDGLVIGQRVEGKEERVERGETQAGGGVRVGDMMRRELGHLYNSNGRDDHS